MKMTSLLLIGYGVAALGIGFFMGQSTGEMGRGSARTADAGKDDSDRPRFRSDDRPRGSAQREAGSRPARASSYRANSPSVFGGITEADISYLAKLASGPSDAVNVLRIARITNKITELSYAECEAALALMETNKELFGDDSELNDIGTVVVWMRMAEVDLLQTMDRLDDELAEIGGNSDIDDVLIDDDILPIMLVTAMGNDPEGTYEWLNGVQSGDISVSSSIVAALNFNDNPRFGQPIEHSLVWEMKQNEEFFNSLDQSNLPDWVQRGMTEYEPAQNIDVVDEAIFEDDTIGDSFQEREKIIIVEQNEKPRPE